MIYKRTISHTPVNELTASTRTSLKAVNFHERIPFPGIYSTAHFEERLISLRKAEARKKH